MKIFFSSRSDNKSKVDEAFEEEYVEALRAGFRVSLVNLDDIKESADEAAKKKILIPNGGSLRTPRSTGCYRGHPINSKYYTGFSWHLSKRGYSSLTKTVSYKGCLLFPESYSFLQRYATPRSWWTNLGPNQEINMRTIIETVKPFGNRSIVVRDYAATREHEWDTASLIPDASNHEDVERVVRDLCQKQGEDLEGGLVFREFVELDDDGNHDKECPTPCEFRIFSYQGSLLSAIPLRNTDLCVNKEAIPLKQFAGIVNAVPSRFFTIDIARRQDGTWMIMGLGDGQVSPIPPGKSIRSFYEKWALYM